MSDTTRTPTTDTLRLRCEMSGDRESLDVAFIRDDILKFTLPGCDDFSVLVGPEQLRRLRDKIDVALAADQRRKWQA